MDETNACRDIIGELKGCKVELQETRLSLQEEKRARLEL
jgi:hypothetical protein